jgi:hypothetical protein
MGEQGKLNAPQFFWFPGTPMYSGWEGRRAMKRSNSEHFGAEDWVDFVNGTASQTKLAALQRHLDEGCRVCARERELWTKVRESARREASLEVPESAVRHVQSAFRVSSEALRAKRRFEIPRLVFDSLWQPAPAGVRSATVQPRQVLYRAGEIAVELRVEPEPLSERLSVVGQIYRTANATEGLARIAVLATGKGGSLAEAHTNDFGEFQMSFLPQSSLRIVFGLPEGQNLTIPLDTSGVAVFGEG